jgi:hypothetical protein
VDNGITGKLNRQKRRFSASEIAASRAIRELASYTSYFKKYTYPANHPPGSVCHRTGKLVGDWITELATRRNAYQSHGYTQPQAHHFGVLRAGVFASESSMEHDMNEITTLNGLANGIREKHQAALDAAANAVSLAREAGELLIQAKAQVGHGQWANWLKANVQFSERTAQGYMRLVRELPKLDDEKAQRVAVMPLRQALKAIADQDEVGVAYDPEMHALRIIYDIRGAIRDWNEATGVLFGEDEGDANHAAFLLRLLKWKVDNRMDGYHKGLHKLAASGVAFASPMYQKVQHLVREMDALGKDLGELFESHPEIGEEPHA